MAILDELLAMQQPVILIVAIASFFSLAVALCFTWLVGASRARRLVVLEQQQQVISKQLNILLSGASGMGQRMISLETKLRSLQHTQDDICHNDGDFSYTQAQKLIAQGVDAKTVAANSGLSMSEIGLMKMLHAPHKMAHG